MIATICLSLGLVALMKMVLVPASLTTARLSIQELLLAIIKLIFFSFLYWKIAMGLLNKKKWARLVSILMFVYSFFKYILDITFGNYNSFFFFYLLFTVIALYGLTLDKSVNDYFN
ncbi:MAG: hypothetical protein AAF349_06125 [Cyanobacteria bacterium P01_A01_bin.68]